MSLFRECVATLDPYCGWSNNKCTTFENKGKKYDPNSVIVTLSKLLRCSKVRTKDIYKLFSRDVMAAMLVQQNIPWENKLCVLANKFHQVNII